MRVLIGIAQDADDRDPVAADLLGHAAVEILRRHDCNFAAGRLGVGERRTRNQERHPEPDDRLHRQAFTVHMVSSFLVDRCGQDTSM